MSVMTNMKNFILLASLLLLFVFQSCASHNPGYTGASGVDTLFPVERDFEWGFINRSGDLISPYKYEGAVDF